MHGREGHRPALAPEASAGAHDVRRTCPPGSGLTCSVNYEAAASGQKDCRAGASLVSDGAAATFGAIEPVRGAARDLVRNNPYAASALNIVTDHVIGAGVSPSVENQLWMQWAGTTDCDADGRHDLNGLMRLALRCIAESGEVLIRQRGRRVSDGFAIPMQLQVLEPDYLDSERLEYGTAPGENRIIQGVEFDLLGKRAAYWMFSRSSGRNQQPDPDILAPRPE